jgi:hypothetical protein
MVLLGHRDPLITEVCSDTKDWHGKMFAADSPVYIYAGNYHPEAGPTLRPPDNR